MSAIIKQQEWFAGQANIWHPVITYDSENLVAVQELDKTRHNYRPGIYLKVKTDGTEFTIRTLTPAQKLSDNYYSYGGEISLFIGATPEQAREERAKIFTFSNLIKTKVIMSINEFIKPKELSNIVFDYLDQTLSQILFIAAKKINIMTRERYFSDFTDNPLTDCLYPEINQKNFWSHFPFRIKAQCRAEHITPSPSDNALAIVPSRKIETPLNEKNIIMATLVQYHFNCRNMFLLNNPKFDGSTIQTDREIEKIIQEETKPLETLQFLKNSPEGAPTPANPPLANRCNCVWACFESRSVYTERG